MHTNLTKWGNSQIKKLSYAFNEVYPGMRKLQVKDRVETALISQIANFKTADMDSDLSSSLS